MGPTARSQMDGAWWPHDDRLLARELPSLVGQLAGHVGVVDQVSLNWKPGSRRSAMVTATMPESLSRTPCHWVITVHGEHRTVRVLVVPARTRLLLARAVLRLAAQMPVLDWTDIDDAALRIIKAA
ncbi:MAG: DUF5994 family protein [Mycobacterium sp.]